MKQIIIKYRSARIHARYNVGEWAYLHPVSRSWQQEPKQILQGWSEQSDHEQSEWEKLIECLVGPGIQDWLDQAEDGDIILCRKQGTLSFRYKYQEKI